MNKEEILKQLIDRLLELPKFKNFDSDKKEKLKEKLLNEYNERINKVIVINIPKEKSEEFLSVLDTNDLNIIDKFILDNIPQIDELIEAETSRFIQQIILKGSEE